MLYNDIDDYKFLPSTLPGDPLVLTRESLRTAHRVHECVLWPPVALCAGAWTRVFPPRQRSYGDLNRVAVSPRVALHI